MPFPEKRRASAKRLVAHRGGQNHRLLRKKRMFRSSEREKQSIALEKGMLLASCSISLYEQFPKFLVSKRNQMTYGFNLFVAHNPAEKNGLNSKTEKLFVILRHEIGLN